MTDEENSFAARRARYLAKQGIEDRPAGAEPARVDPYAAFPARPARRRVGPSIAAFAFVSVAVIGVGIAAVTALPGALQSAKDSHFFSAVAAATGMGGMTSIDGTPLRPQNAPPPIRELSERGWIHRSPSVAHAGEAELDIHAVASGLPVEAGPLPPDVPAATVALDPNPGCALRPRAPGARLAGVRIAGGERAAGVTALSDAAIAGQVLENVRKLTEIERFEPALDRRMGSTLAGESLSVVDVFVTDRAGPVHLVLQNMWNPVLWNLHIGPGVTVSGITLVGSDYLGIAGHDGIPVDVLRVADGCARPVAREPEAHWVFMEEAKRWPVSVQANQMKTLTEHYATYAAWYEEAFAASPAAFTLRPEHADHVLIGAPPAVPVAYTPLSERTAAVAAADHVLLGTSEAREAAARALHDALVERATGGEPAVLDPNPVERMPL